MQSVIVIVVVRRFDAMGTGEYLLRTGITVSSICISLVAIGRKDLVGGQWRRMI